MPTALRGTTAFRATTTGTRAARTSSFTASAAAIRRYAGGASTPPSSPGRGRSAFAQPRPGCLYGGAGDFRPSKPRLCRLLQGQAQRHRQAPQIASLRSLVVLGVLLALSGAASAADALKGVALVIGESRYDSPLLPALS